MRTSQETGDGHSAAIGVQGSCQEALPYRSARRDSVLGDQPTRRARGVSSVNGFLWASILSILGGGCAGSLFFEKGLADYKKGNLDGAIKNFSRAVSLNGELAAAYYNRGIAHGNQGAYELAMRDYSKAIEIDPDFAEAYNNRGLLRAGRGEVEKAILDYDHAIVLASGSPDAYYNRGNAYREQGNYGLAIQDYTRAIEIDPGHIAAYNNRGVTYGKRGDYDLAVQDLTQAMDLCLRAFPLFDRELAQISYNRAVILEVRGKPVRAARDYSMACKYGYQLGCERLYERRSLDSRK